ncbi:hypothetical protein BDY19DRAFT_998573 [Irpex rosettiformis]|uniref:Uncharacterized protein n=1 Tax=Irpex rosettiformis TaxID=378272 RepID=A0ACB8TN44_9APHY|nr:hypothetical protein BDY19DRAFT_998573 [Irpex rosettiformis]
MVLSGQIPPQYDLDDDDDRRRDLQVGSFEPASSIALTADVAHPWILLTHYRYPRPCRRPLRRHRRLTGNCSSFPPEYSPSPSPFPSTRPILPARSTFTPLPRFKKSTTGIRADIARINATKYLIDYSFNRVVNNWTTQLNDGRTRYFPITPSPPPSPPSLPPPPQKTAPDPSSSPQTHSPSYPSLAPHSPPSSPPPVHLRSTSPVSQAHASSRSTG